MWNIHEPTYAAYAVNTTSYIGKENWDLQKYLLVLTWCSKVLDVFLDMTWCEGFYKGSYWKLLNLAFTINDITILDLKANSKVFDKSSTQKETGKGKLFNYVNNMISMDTGMKVLDLLNYCLQQCLILNWNLAWA